MAMRGRLGILLVTLGALAVIACGDDDGEPPGFLGSDTPTATATATGTPTSEVAGASATATPGNPTEYVVQPGDTLSLIAAEFGTTVLAIVELNGIADPSLIHPGDVIRLPQ